jgi:hypothetical protein
MMSMELNNHQRATTQPQQVEEAAPQLPPQRIAALILLVRQEEEQEEEELAADLLQAEEQCGSTCAPKCLAYAGQLTFIIALFMPWSVLVAKKVSSHIDYSLSCSSISRVLDLLHRLEHGLCSLRRSLIIFLIVLGPKLSGSICLSRFTRKDIIYRSFRVSW